MMTIIDGETMPQKLGLYIHVPFCLKKCLYCDFCSFPRPTEDDMRAYAEALCRDLERSAEDCSDRTVDTVYFGGGTPTLMPTRLLDRITDCLARGYHLSENVEMTAECNPATADREKRLKGWKKLSPAARAGLRTDF